MNELVGRVADARRLRKEHACNHVRRIIGALQQWGTIDAVDEWMLEEIMARQWGGSDDGSNSIVDDGWSDESTSSSCSSSSCNSLFVKALQFRYGYEVNGNDTMAFRMACRGVSLDDPSGRCHRLAAHCHMHCLGTHSRNASLAMRLYRLSAKRGNAAALHQLALGLDGGSTAEQQRANRMLLHAHLAGNPEASLSLAHSYDCGRGVSVNGHFAVALVREAAIRGHREALARMASWGESTVLARRHRLVPLSCWAPRKYIHTWVPSDMKRSIVALLMAHRRPDEGFVRMLPRQIVWLICFYVVTRPLPAARRSPG